MNQPNSQTDSLDQRVKQFAAKLKRDFATEIIENPRAFKARLIGKIRVALPRKPPGRRGSPEVRRAAEIYLRDYKSKQREGNWHEIGKQVIPDYGKLTPQIQRLHRMSLRANVHSFLYEDRTRRRRREE
jgi:hypothetical protein